MRVRKLAHVMAATAALLLCVSPAKVLADVCATNPDLQSCTSGGFGVNEVYFGPGGQLNGSSTNYRADSSVGDTTVGNTKSTNYQANTGGQTNRNESLEFSITTPNIDFGVLSASTAKTATANFTVKSYLSSGYVVTNASDPPTNGSYTFPASAAGTASAIASAPGTAQFGINLVRNLTSCTPPAPANFGSDPVQDYPDTPPTTFGYGVAAAGYNTCGKFKYTKGETIASAASSSGVTQYTVSYLYNISNSTPAGTYNFRHVMVATATF